MMIPFFSIKANLVKFRHFQKNYLQMKFSLIKKAENEYFGQIMKKSFWFCLQLTKISSYFDQKQKILPLSNFSLWLFLRQNSRSVITVHDKNFFVLSPILTKLSQNVAYQFTTISQNVIKIRPKMKIFY